MTLCKLLSLHLVLVLCVGCATSEMTIHVDMYDENPKIEPLLTPSQAEQMILNTQKLAVAAQQDYSHRLYVNTRAVELYTSAWQGAGGSRLSDKLWLDSVLSDDSCKQQIQKLNIAQQNGQDVDVTDFFLHTEMPTMKAMGELEKLYFRMAQYTQAECENILLFQSKINTVYNNLDAYLETLRNRIAEFQAADTQDKKTFKKNNKIPKQDHECSNTKLYTEKFSLYCADKGEEIPESLGNDRALRELAKSIELQQAKTDILTSTARLVAQYEAMRQPAARFYINWANLENLLNVVLLNAKNSKEKQRIRAIADNVKINIQQLVAMSTARYGGSNLSAASLNKQLGSQGLSSSVKALGNELELLRENQTDSVSASTALIGLVQNSSKFMEQIDRLQDSGDPVWRAVTDPANEAHWNKKFAKTYFSGDGKVSALVVRDNPIRYRVHYGENSVSAAVKSQLNIARSLADAALTVAGGVAGAGVKLGEDGATSLELTTQADAVAKQVELKTSLDAREKAITNMKRNLRDLLEEVNQADDSQTKELASRLRAILEGHKPLFEHE